MLGISRDPPEAQRRFKEKYQLPFPLLSFSALAVESWPTGLDADERPFAPSFASAPGDASSTPAPSTAAAAPHPNLVVMFPPPAFTPATRCRLGAAPHARDGAAREHRGLSLSGGRAGSRGRRCGRTRP